MRKRLTSFVLIAAFVGGLLAGVHAHAGAHDCPLKGIDDCCATAHGRGGGPEVSAARLCCALNCKGPGTTGPSDAFKVSPLVALALSTGAVPPTAAASLPRPLPRRRSASGPPPDSHPAYIRHLALLI